MGIGKRIRIATDALGLTLKQVAEKCDISYSSLQNWAGGHREPRVDALVALGSQLGISIDWLLTGNGSMLRDAAATHHAEQAENPREQALLALWRELDEEQQRDIQRNAEEKKRLTDLETRIRELEAVVADSKRLA